MGREVKRIAVDFEWPIGKVWEGYINPYGVKCEACDGSGSTMASRRLHDLVSLLMLSGEDAMKGECHPYFFSIHSFETRGKVCGPDMVELTTALAGRAPSFLGHDAIDSWSAFRKIIEAAGLSADWGTCPDCGGHGVTPESYAKQEAWRPTEPPEGVGYQIWETVSEGSPVSPVFEKPEELAKWMMTCSYESQEMTYEKWLNFIQDKGWAPSLVMDKTGVHEGVSVYSPAAEQSANPS